MTWRAYGASVRGTGHTRTKLPCQDAHGWRFLPSGIACAVADGLGSAARADAGAQMVVVAALDSLAASPASDIGAAVDVLRAAFVAAREALVKASGDALLHDFATTLLLAVATADWIAVGHIGDGAAVGRWADGRLETLSLPERGEYSNETTPVTADDALDRLRIAVWPAPVQALVLFSDGLQAVALDFGSGAPFAPFFVPFLQALADPFDPAATGERLAAFLESPRVCARTDDDKTILVAGLSHPR